MRYDDDAIERALAALPLEDTPPGLHARILGATVRRPAPVFQPWELWVIGGALALVTWVVLALLGSAALAHAIGTTVDRIGALLGEALNPAACVWLAIGVSAAVWLSLSGPGGGRDEAEA